MKPHFRDFLLTLSLSLLSVSCQVQETGLFYSIEQERKLGDNSLDNNLTAGKLLVIDIDKDGQEDYLLAAGRVYNVDAAENAQYVDASSKGTWRTDYDVPAEKLCLRIFEIDATIYGLLYAKNQPGETLMDSHLYSLDAPSKEWSLVTEGELDKKIIEDAESAGGVIYYSSYTQETLEATGDGEDRIKRTYGLGYYNPSATGTKLGTVADLSDFRSTHLDAATGGGITYLVYGTKIFSGGTPSAISEISPEDPSLDEITGDSDTVTDSTAFRGIHYSSIHSTFFLSTSDGSIWYIDGGKWVLDNKIEDMPFDFTDFQLGGINLLLVGSEDGYYEKNGSDSGFAAPSSGIETDSYTTLDLRKAVVNELFVNEEGTSGDGVLFVLTSGYGLWSNRKEGETRIWNQE